MTDTKPQDWLEENAARAATGGDHEDAAELLTLANEHREEDEDHQK